MLDLSGLSDLTVKALAGIDVRHAMHKMLSSVYDRVEAQWHSFVPFALWYPWCTSNKCRPRCSVYARAFHGLGIEFATQKTGVAAFLEGSFGNLQGQVDPKALQSQILVSIDVKLLIFSHGIENRAVLKHGAAGSETNPCSSKPAELNAGTQSDGPFLTSPPRR
jgi:hypothetical protein